MWLTANPHCHRLDAFKNNNIIKGSLDNIKKKKVTKFLCPELSSSFFFHTKKTTISEKEGSGEAQVPDFNFNVLFLVLCLAKLKYKMKSKIRQ